MKPSLFSTPAILLRRVEYGDSDLILTLLTLDRGKISAIAKAAKKSVRRFGGVLELFSVMDAVFRIGRKGKLPFLEEAALKEPFADIRMDYRKTAYASYWAEVMYAWMEENVQQERLFKLLYLSLEAINAGDVSREILSIIFQMKFLRATGIGPNLRSCCDCKKDVEYIAEERFRFDLKKGGVVCGRCSTGINSGPFLSKGTMKQLNWAGCKAFSKATRIRFSPLALKEGLHFLEKFVPWHMGKDIRSLKFLRDLRAGRDNI